MMQSKKKSISIELKHKVSSWKIYRTFPGPMLGSKGMGVIIHKKGREMQKKDKIFKS